MQNKELAKRLNIVAKSLEVTIDAVLMWAPATPRGLQVDPVSANIIRVKDTLAEARRELRNLNQPSAKYRKSQRSSGRTNNR